MGGVQKGIDEVEDVGPRKGGPKEPNEKLGGKKKMGPAAFGDPKKKKKKGVHPRMKRIAKTKANLDLNEDCRWGPKKKRKGGQGGNRRGIEGRRGMSGVGGTDDKKRDPNGPVGAIKEKNVQDLRESGGSGKGVGGN